MAKLMVGLKPRGFTWVIADRLAVSERVGGIGFQHRRVRREEEVHWLVEEGRITTIISLLPGNQNVSAYTEAGIEVIAIPVTGSLTRAACGPIYEALDVALSEPKARVLIHREIVDDSIAGLLCGYLIHSGLVTDPVLAVAVIQEILGRPLGPVGRSLVPDGS